MENPAESAVLDLMRRVWTDGSARVDRTGVGTRALFGAMLRFDLSDGTVEMLVQGPADEVDRCIREVQDSFAGYIRDARIEQIPCNPRYSDFGIVH